MLSIGTIRFEDRFFASREGGDRERWVVPPKKLLARSSASLYKRAYKMVLSHCRDSISGFLGSFRSGGAFSGQRALTIGLVLHVTIA